MNFPRISARYVAAKSLRSAGVSYPTARWLSLLLIPWRKRA